MTHSRSRRQFISATIPIALSGCLVESRDNTTSSSDHTDTSTTQIDDRSGGNNDTDEAVPENDTKQPSPTSEEIVVENMSIDRIIESIYLSQIVADITVRNTADWECQSLELRVDAYYNPPEDDRTYHPPRVDERTAVGYRYVDREFDNFGSGTRTFEDVVIQYDADADANDSTDPDTFDLSVAIRNIEQS